MAITDFATLKSTVQGWIARSDSTFGNMIETFVAQAEDRIYNGAGADERDPLFSEPVRAPVMETSTTLTITGGVGTLPSNCLGARSIIRAGDQIGLDYLPPHRWHLRNADPSGGNPGYYTVEGSSLKLTPTYDGNVTLLYWKRFPGLSSTVTTSDMLTAHPMLYLEAVLFEAYTFEAEPELALGQLAKLRAHAAGLNKTAKGIRYGGPPRKIIPRQAIP